jgi:ubiquinone/menaquinone biosynthesis C-methylase UbiE
VPVDLADGTRRSGHQVRQVKPPVKRAPRIARAGGRCQDGCGDQDRGDQAGHVASTPLGRREFQPVVPHNHAMALDVSARPLFARCLARSAAIAERKGAALYRQRLLAGLRGRVIEVGAGSGIHFRHYPPTVTEVVAVEPEPNLRALAEVAAARGPVRIEVVEGLAEALPADDESMDAGLAAGVLCSVPEPTAALAELVRVIRPGGELRFFEHVVSRRPRAAQLQRALDASGVWSHMMGGCQTSRDTEAEITRAGFRIESIERFAFRPTPLDIPVAPKILGRATRV